MKIWIVGTLLTCLQANILFQAIDCDQPDLIKNINPKKLSSAPKDESDQKDITVVQSVETFNWTSTFCQVRRSHIRYYCAHYRFVSLFYLVTTQLPFPPLPPPPPHQPDIPSHI